MKSAVVVLMLSVFAIVTCSIAGESNTDGDRATKIVSGFNSTRGQFPHHVLFFYPPIFNANFCGGVLISSNHVLTAAHCVAHGQHSFTIHLGALTADDLSEEGRVIRRTNTSYVHPYYAPAASVLNDIAILYFDEPVEFSDIISPIRLPPPEERFDGVPAILSGFGARNSSKVATSPILQWTHLYTIGMLRCTRDLGPLAVRPSVICANGKGGEAACFGDSGSPLISKDGVLIGLTSFGRSCDGGHPTVFTRVTSFLKWIQTIVGSAIPGGE